MSVYFAQVGRYIKIGYSENPERRVKNLFKSATRYSAPRDISASTPRVLLGHVPGGVDDERGAHIALDEFRVSGEWFLDEPEVRDYIARCIGCDDIATELVTRPAGNYRRDDDPILALSPEEQEELRRAVNNIFSGTSLASPP